MFRSALPFVLFALVPMAATAYPISPTTIWDLTWSADKIVLARVDSVVTVAAHTERGDRDGYPERARLEVIETWKGKHEPRVEVSFDSGYICPAPDEYIPGRRVVAFLARNDDQWVTVALSYGTRYPVGESAEGEYRRVVQLAQKEQQALSRPKDGEWGPPASRSWALAAIEGRSTRWDGLYHLSRESDPAHSYYDQSRTKELPIPEAALTQLEKVFVASPSYDATLPQMLRLLKTRKSAAVTQAAVDAIETVLRGESSDYWMPEAIDLVKERLGGEKAEPPIDLAARSGALDEQVAAEAKLALRTPLKRTTVEREESSQKSWDDLKQKLRLKPRVRTDYQRIPRTATGGDTSL